MWNQLSRSEVEIILQLIDDGGDTETNRERLVVHGERALPAMCECLTDLRTWRARQAVVYTAIKFARRSDLAKRIGFIGLEDKSKRVRQTACALAAFSLDYDFIAPLSVLRMTSDAATAEDAGAAISAIRNQNHHLFMDRQGTGRVFWNVMGSDIES